MAETTKKTPAKKTTAPAAKKPVAAKAPVAKKPAAPKAPVETAAADATPEVATTFEKPTIAKGRYIFATGRRKTAIANVRLFAGSEDNIINKKKMDVYFTQKGMQ